MLKARNERRRRELKEFAYILASAFHDPENLEKLFKPTINETLSRAKQDDTAWETDRWWESQT